jgi:hypothetical protein
MQNLLQLLRDLKVPLIEQLIIVVPIDETSIGTQKPSYQLQLDLESDD